MAKITDITAWFQKNSSWIKTVFILLLLGLLILAFISFSNISRQRDKFIAQTTTLHILNDSLVAYNDMLKEYVTTAENKKDDYYRHLTILVKENDSLLEVSNNQKRIIKNISSEVAGMKTDSVYKHLTTVAYPDSGKAIYPFSENQIRRIEENYFKTIALEQLSHVLEDQVTNSTAQFMNMDSIITTYKSISMNLALENSNLTDIITNKDKEIDLYKKQDRKIKNSGLIWKISTGVTTAVALILAF